MDETTPVPASTTAIRQADSDDHLVQMFLRRYEARSPHTLRAYRSDVARLLDVVARPLREMTVDVLQAYQDQLQGTPATKARAISTVRSLFAFGHRLGYLTFNPAAVVDLPRVAVTSGDRFLTADECRGLLAALKGNPVHELVGSLLINTGLRVAEAAGIKWSAFYLDPQGFTGLKVTGKGNRTRNVKITSDVWKLLTKVRHLDGMPAEIDPQDHRHLFNGQRGPLTTNGIWRVISTAAERAGIRKKVSPHWLRHSHATLSILAGATISEVKDALGHGDIRTSARYEHSVKQLQRTTADLIKL